jgi:hypothetical protein
MQSPGMVVGNLGSTYEKHAAQASREAYHHCHKTSSKLTSCLSARCKP